MKMTAKVKTTARMRTTATTRIKVRVTVRTTARCQCLENRVNSSHNIHIEHSILY